MDLVFRYNPEVEDVEIVSVINEQETVLDTVGSDVVASWVDAYNEKHGYVERAEVEANAQEQIDAAVQEAIKNAEAEKVEAVEEAKRVAAEAAAAAKE